MLHMLQDVRITFQRFTEARGDSVQHGCNIESDRRARPRPPVRGAWAQQLGPWGAGGEL